jgi:hypothetical protein
MENTYIQRKRGINMGSLKNILIHCQEFEKEYEQMGIKSDNPKRLVNRGWIDALKFVQDNFDIEFNTIKEERE